MSQKIVTVCDAHQVHDEEVPALSWEVTLRAPGASRATTWAVDLCEEDGKTLEDLATMLGAVGRVTDGPRRTVNTAARVAARAAQGRPHRATNRGANAAVGTDLETPEGWPCPVDGCEKVSNSRTGLASHVRHVHGISLAEVIGAPTPYLCPDCPRAFSHRQGLGAHRRSAHGAASGSGAA